MPLLSNEISNLMAEIRSDKDIFENFEIDSTFAKYSMMDGNSQVFDYWYNKFDEVKGKIDGIVNNVKNDIIEEFKAEFQKLFNNCYICYTELFSSLSKFSAYSISMVRANIDLVNRKIILMILYKTTDITKTPEELVDYLDFQKEIYKIQESCNDKFKPHVFSISNLHWDDSISVDCITRDFPICIRK
jgi:hypothetical protein